ncbi:proline-rich protein 5 [Ornithorhynchus anatinus]|nr:proline-rich protein 5 [Ornithorhynchus anatinus]XP_028934330.1 proline-rich protein 5 [Ornithorhynchus anatinus]XP_028934332.1 proline-rich protein 5 [Ornithorhynchus anatinus]
MVILRDKVHFYEGQKLLDSLAETWEFFFGHALPTLQAIFYPVQGKEPPLRQRALLHFRDIIALNVRLDDALARPRARVPPAVIQMLLVLQGVHESQGVTEEYLKLEALVQKVVSPYLGTYGLYSRDGPFTHSCLLENRFSRRPKPGEALAKSAVSRSKSYNHPLLMPVVEFEAEGPVPNCGPAGRKRSLSEMASCPELQALPRPPPAPPGPDPGGHGRDPDPDPPRDPAPGPAPSSSPELAVDRILESLDSDAEGIFIDFSRGRSGPAGVCLDGGRQSVV